jgi:hypothetical protein
MRRLWNRGWTWYKGLRRGWQVVIALALGVLTVGAMVDDQHQIEVEQQKAAAIEAAKPHAVDVRGLTLPVAQAAQARGLQRGPRVYGHCHGHLHRGELRRLRAAGAEGSSRSAQGRQARLLMSTPPSNPT